MGLKWVKGEAEDGAEPDARLQIVVTDQRGWWTQRHEIIQVMTKESHPIVMSQYPFHDVYNGKEGGKGWGWRS